MTFWDFYAAHPVLGTIAVLLGFILAMIVLLIVSDLRITYRSGSSDQRRPPSP